MEVRKRLKFIVVVGDGMADEPLEELGGKTPLEAACTPNMDFYASQGLVGLLRTIPEGMPPGSDIANMSLMGCSPREYYTGRAPLEAASMGLKMEPGDMAFRCNLVTLGEGNLGSVMVDHSGGSISTEAAGEYIRVLNESLSGPGLRFHLGVSYRHVLLLKGTDGEFDRLETTPPHDILGQEISSHLPKGKGREKLIGLMEQGQRVLMQSVERVAQTGLGARANSIWFWGQGPVPRLPVFAERFGVQGATVCAVDLMKGMGTCMGLKTIEVPGATGDLDTDYQGKAVAALETVEDVDFVFLHVEAPDEAGHQGNLEEKVKAIERVDGEVLGILRKGLEEQKVPYRLLVLPDHPTPIRTRTHSDAPVPFILYASSSGDSFGQLAASSCAPSCFHEAEAARSGIIIEEGHKILEIMFDRS